MHITCHNCKKTWKVPTGHILGAKLKFGLGFKDHGFICPNCNVQNVLTEQEFEAAESGKAQIPVTGTQTGTGTANEGRQPRGGVVGRAPTNPVPGPGPSVRQRQGVVRVRSLHVRRDHSTRAETMAGLRKGEKVTILNTWTDGENTWAQLGPERWAAIEHNGEALIDLLDD
jgi:hypothetical protein